jgi:uncharacterized protein (TIGR02266 family)
MQSKRRYRRRTIRIVVDYVSNAGPRREIATTLGAGGLFIETDSPAREGTVLKLRFRVSEASDEHEIEGRVVWSRGPYAEDHSGAPGMGIEFTDRRAINKLATELEHSD